MANKLSKKNSKMLNKAHDSQDNEEADDVNEIDENNISSIKQIDKSISNTSYALNESRSKIAQQSKEVRNYDNPK